MGYLFNEHKTEYDSLVNEPKVVYCKNSGNFGCQLRLVIQLLHSIAFYYPAPYAPSLETRGEEHFTAYQCSIKFVQQLKKRSHVLLDFEQKHFLKTYIASGAT